ncbi:MAG: histidine kinase N-terminal 7TM domain-containing protein [Thermoplasmata archaeon]
MGGRIRVGFAFNWASVIPFIAVCVNMLLGIYTFKLEPKNRLNRLFLVMELFVSAMCLFTFMFYNRDDFQSAKNIAKCIYITSMFIPALSLHFALLFPKETKCVTKYPFIIYYIYIPILAFLILFILNPGFFLLQGVNDAGQTVDMVAESATWRWSMQYDIGDDIFWVLGALYFAVTIYILYKEMKNAENDTQRNQIRFVLVGVTIPMIYFIALQLIPDLLNSAMDTDYFFIVQDNTFPTIFMGLLITVAIVKYELFHIGKTLERSIFYMLILLFVIIIFETVSEVVENVGGWLLGTTSGIGSIISSVITAVAMISLLDPLKAKVAAFCDRLFPETKCFEYDQNKKLYYKTLETALADDVITEDELAMLKTQQRILKISPEDHDEIYRQIVKEKDADKHET